MSYTVRLRPSAKKRLDASPVSLRERILAALGALETDPRPAGSIVIEGGERHRRIRVGDYRVNYLVNDDDRSVFVDRIDHRRDVYRRLGR